MTHTHIILHSAKILSEVITSVLKLNIPPHTAMRLKMSWLDSLSESTCPSMTRHETHDYVRVHIKIGLRLWWFDCIYAWRRLHYVSPQQAPPLMPAAVGWCWGGRGFPAGQSAAYVSSAQSSEDWQQGWVQTNTINIGIHTSYHKLPANDTSAI